MKNGPSTERPEKACGGDAPLGWLPLAEKAIPVVTPCMVVSLSLATLAVAPTSEINVMRSSSVCRDWDNFTTRLGPSGATSREVTIIASEELRLAEWREGAREYLRTHAHLTDHVERACRVVRSLFGDAAKIAFEVFVEPESVSADPILFLMVGTTVDPDTAIEKLARFDREWRIPNRDSTDGQIQVDVEFI